MLRSYNNVKITEFNKFAGILEEIGFMPFSNNCLELTSLNSLTEEPQWHTNLPSDPWQWRIKIELEHKAAYGKLFDKKPGFITLDWYPYFLSARRNKRSFEELYDDGLISNAAKQIYRLFEKNQRLATHEIKALGGFTKETNSKYETAITELQMWMFITSNGTIRKIGADGQPYGWPAIAYSTVEEWAGSDLIEQAYSINTEDAKEIITNRILEQKPNADLRKIKKFAGI